MPKLELEDWVIEAHVDDDGHLLVVLNHADGSKISDVGEDLAHNDSEYAARYTTEQIEDEYKATL
jgi:hypothetical protein